MNNFFLNKLNDRFYTGAQSTNVIHAGHTTVTLKSMLKQIDEMQKSCEPHSIPVWIGDRKLRDLPECPPFMESDLIDPDTLYIVAGVGILLGTSLVPKIWEAGFLSEWVKDSPPKGDK